MLKAPWILCRSLLARCQAKGGHLQ